MDNNNAFPNANNQNFDIPPALTPEQMQQQQQQQAYQPTQTNSLNNPAAPNINNTGVPLQSPILAPTHFDGMKPADIQNPYAAAPKPQTTPDKSKSYMRLAVAFGFFAVIGIILGVVSLVLYVTTNEDLQAKTNELESKSAIVTEVENQTGKTIKSVDDLPAYAPVTGYIYISEWGIKFKIPSDLSDLSYILDQKYRPQICFNGYQTGVKYFPGFADIDQNPGGMGCVTRVATYEGLTEEKTGYSFGTLVYTYNDYNYFYNAPQRMFSTNEAEQGLETTAVQIIKNMISNNIGHYE